MRREWKKLISVLVTAAMLLGLLPVAALAEEKKFADLPADWSTAALTRAVEDGLLQGSRSDEDGQWYLKPGANLLRAELAAVVARGFGAERRTAVGASDAPNGAWFTPELEKAVAMGVFKAESAMRPGDSITRQETFTALARAFQVSASDPEKALAPFSDGADVADWAKQGVAGLVEAGYVSGSEGKLNPASLITRAEFAQLMGNLVGQYVKTAGVVTELGEGNVMVTVPGVTLKNVTVKGDLIVGDGVGDGDFSIDGVTVTGRMLVRGGGENSIHVTGKSSVAIVVMAKNEGAVRLSVESGASVASVTVPEGADKVVVTGKVDTLSVLGAGATVSAVGAEIKNIQVAGAQAALTVDKGSKVTNVEIAESAQGAALQADKGATIQTVASKAEGVAIQGEGKIVTAKIEGNNTNVSTPGTKVEVAKDVEGATAGDKPLTGGSTTTTPGGSGNNDSGPSTPPGWNGTDTTEVKPEGGVYTVKTAAELAWIGKQVNDGTESFAGKTVKLGADIYLNDQEWTPIGTQTKPFMGNLDGSSKTISGLKINSAREEGHLALFGYVAGTEQSHVTFKGLTVRGTVANTCTTFERGETAADDYGRYTALLIAEAEYIDLIGIVAEGTVSSACRTAGGIVGKIVVEGSQGNSVASVQSCVSRVTVTGYDQVGGIVGYTRTNSTGYMSFVRCGNEGSVMLSGAAEKNEAVGGIVGLSGMTSFDQCYNKGAISGRTAGGIVGIYNSGKENGIYITNCYNQGAVDGGAGAAGGILGCDTTGDGVVQFCYNSGNVTTSNQPTESKSTSAGIYGSTTGTFSTNMKNNYYLREHANFGACDGGKAQDGSGDGTAIVGMADVAGQFEVKSDEELKSAAVAMALNNNAMDESAPWRIVPNSYPVLACENVPGAEVPVPTPWDGKTVDVTWYNDSDSSFDISTPEELAGLAKLVNDGNTFAGKTINLTANINLGGYEWTPIGKATSAFIIVDGAPFSGTFNGGYHSILNVSIQQSGSEEMQAAGLFAYVSEGKIQKLHVQGNIQGDYIALAGIVGVGNGATFSECSFSGSVHNTDQSEMNMAAGIIAHDAQEITLEKCWNEADVTGLMAAGIVVITVDGADISYCYNTGTITGEPTENSEGIDYSIASGIMTMNAHGKDTKFIECFNVGTVNAFQGGGILGMTTDRLTMEKCFKLSGCVSTNAEYPPTEDFYDGTGYGNVRTITAEQFKNLSGLGFTESVWKIQTGAQHPTLKVTK